MARRSRIDPLPDPGLHRLPPATAHHLARVLRMRTGDSVVLFDGHGRECHGHIRRVQGDQVEVECGPPSLVQREPAVVVWLAFALPKAARAEWLFEHGTEIGVARFLPVIPARAEASARDGRRDRWRRIAAAAAAQCDRSHVPEIEDPQTLAAFLARTDLPHERYLADAHGAPLVAARSTTATWLVGPPGGLTASELQAAQRAGFEPRSLGPLTLRTETAGLVGAAILTLRQ